MKAIVFIYLAVIISVTSLVLNYIATLSILTYVKDLLMWSEWVIILLQTALCSATVMIPFIIFYTSRYVIEKYFEE